MSTGADLKVTPQTRSILLALLKDHHRCREVYTAQIAHGAQVPARTVGPVLARLEQAGLAASRMEGEGPQVLGRPWRRYWALTPAGVTYASSL